MGWRELKTYSLEDLASPASAWGTGRIPRLSSGAKVVLRDDKRGDESAEGRRWEERFL